VFKTSETHPIRVDWLPRAAAGAVGLTFAPGKHQDGRNGRWRRSLARDLDDLRDAHGVDVLVCLLEDDELDRLRISGYQAEAEARGITVYRLRIPDGHAPGDPTAVAALLATIAGEVDAGRSVVIHCAGGLGRAGAVGGCWLRERGVGADEALATLRAARGSGCPETEAQRRFIRAWPAGTRRA
jgi:protein-tyrosine phosphatase